jgi:hypothetical protein
LACPISVFWCIKYSVVQIALQLFEKKTGGRILFFTCRVFIASMDGYRTSILYYAGLLFASQLVSVSL